MIAVVVKLYIVTDTQAPLVPFHSNSPQYVTNSLDFIRMRSPNLISKSGTGRNTSAMNASTDVPHPMPSSSYSLGAANGNAAPATHRRLMFAAIADAECTPKASTR